MQSTHYVDVCIVGAGLSGLTAAAQLIEDGREVALLEGRGRVGGRILTATDAAETPIGDLGPAWFWGHNRYVIETLNRFGMRAFNQYESGYHLFEAGPGAALQRFRPEWQQPPTYRIEGGTKALLTPFLSRIPANLIYLNRVVTAIAQRDRAISVSVDGPEGDEHWVAQTVIVTLPPHLAATTIQYQPELPHPVSHAMRSTPTWMGEAMKVVLSYPTPFWRDRQLSGYGISYAGPIQQFHDATPADGSIGSIFGWIGNQSPARGMSRAERKQAVIEQAIRFWGADAAMPLNYAEVNWEEERFTSNQGDEARPKAAEHPEYGHPSLQEPLMDGRLWWATTEASPVGGGYLDGAIFIGQQVAEKIIGRSSGS